MQLTVKDLLAGFCPRAGMIPIAHGQCRHEVLGNTVRIASTASKMTTPAPAISKYMAQYPPRGIYQFCRDLVLLISSHDISAFARSDTAFILSPPPRGNYVTCATISILAHATQFNPLSQHLCRTLRFCSYAHLWNISCCSEVQCRIRTSQKAWRSARLAAVVKSKISACAYRGQEC